MNVRILFTVLLCLATRPTYAVLVEQQGAERVAPTPAEHKDFVEHCIAALPMQPLPEVIRTRVCECTFEKMVLYVPKSELTALQTAMRDKPEGVAPEQFAPHMIEVSRMCGEIGRRQK